MQTKEYRTIDRQAKEWPSGVWDAEPDKVQWLDEKTGLPCLAVRNERWGFWCGYVGIAPSHPFYEMPYDDIPVDVHGGLTFSNFCQPHETEETGICHAPEPGEEAKVWWAGFDCHHLFDLAPFDLNSDSFFYETQLHEKAVYRTLAYVQQECQNLAEQLAAIK